ncbi:hypothetical protein ZIOFF_018558 [Zingiber officinale]|uniref:SHSP domain-containing protein n=1 Tax=Zingiber officinale TaxID=94328 RepID=A0A8J5H6H5_ZINOF|nr:hypothetical protein ZIOFF_018558 [Zingiber officinale]
MRQKSHSNDEVVEIHQASKSDDVELFSSLSSLNVADSARNNTCGISVPKRYDEGPSAFGEAEHHVPLQRELKGLRCRHAQMTKEALSHIFGKVLELPFSAKANVQAHAIEIQPGVMKVVVQHGDLQVNGGGKCDLDEGLELDRWRLHLSPTTRSALATATYADGELVVIVLKRSKFEGDDAT